MGKVLCFYREVALSCCEQAGLGGRREKIAKGTWHQKKNAHFSILEIFPMLFFHGLLAIVHFWEFSSREFPYLIYPVFLFMEKQRRFIIVSFLIKLQLG